jgi:pilus assembly protein CpaE
LAGLVPGETLRVLLVSISEGARDEVATALADRAGDHRLYWISQPDLAPVRAGDLLPHVVLVDADLGGVLSSALIGQLAARVPQAAILALVNSNDISVARQAILAGARAFVTKPVQGEDLLVALRQVLTGRGASREDEPMVAEASRIVVFCAPKGGTGRSLLALNTAVSLHQQTGQPVVLIDADYVSPGLDVALNLDASRTIADLLPKLAALDATMISSTLATHASGIRVLLAPLPTGVFYSISLPHVQQMLAWLKRLFPWVIVDLGLPLDDTAFAFLDGADRIVMTLLPEMGGLRNARLMLDQLQAHGYPEDKVWMVLNRASMHGGVPMRDIEERLRLQIRVQIPDDQPLATHSINRGVPIATSHSGSAVAKAIEKLTHQLMAERPATTAATGPEPPRRRLFRKV